VVDVAFAIVVPMTATLRSTVANFPPTPEISTVGSLVTGVSRTSSSLVPRPLLRRASTIPRTGR